MDEAGGSENTAGADASVARIDGEAEADGRKRLLEHMTVLKALREADWVREAFLREYLYESIRIARPLLKEYPLLDVERRGVALALLDSFAPEELARFVVERLDAVQQAAQAAEREEAPETLARFFDEEAALVNLIQGGLYALGLVLDEATDACIRIFGPGVLGRLKELRQAQPPGALWWEEALVKPVRAGLASLFAGEGAASELSREEGRVTATYALDDCIARLGGLEQAVSPTRLQAAFAQARTSPAVGLYASLFEAFSPLREAVSCLCGQGLDGPSRAMERLAGLAALDEALWTQVVKAGPVDRERVGLMVRSLGAGALATSVSLIGSLALALKGVEEGAKNRIGALFLDGAVEEGLLLGLRTLFEAQLRDLTADEGGKVRVYATVRRRVRPEAAVAAGLNRIRIKRLFDERGGALVFKAITVKELGREAGLLNLEPETLKALGGLWESAGRETRVHAAILEALVAKTSTNPSAKIVEIVKKLGALGAPRPA